MNMSNDIESCTHSVQYIPQISLQSFEIKQECVICFEVFTEQYKLPCNHTFCDMCIIQWFFQSKQNSCPLCKKNVFCTNIEKKNIYLIYPSNNNDASFLYNIICTVIITLSITITVLFIYSIS